MDPNPIIKSQFQAALTMLEQTLRECPDDLWLEAGRPNAFWHVAYHALFYTHLYLQESEATFEPWSRHQDESQFLGGRLPWPPHEPAKPCEPYTKDAVLEYLAFCRDEVDARVDELDLNGPSGFEWLPFGKLELQFYNIRHLQTHVGELAQRLGERGIEVRWVGRAST